MIFLDTRFLFGLVSTKDESHNRVVEVFASFKGDRLSDEPPTTRHVIAETITLTRIHWTTALANLGAQGFGASQPGSP